jgi:hypothetical protein
MRVGKAWISFDSLVKIEYYQWVARDFRSKKFREHFLPTRQNRGIGSHNFGLRKGRIGHRASLA